VVVVVRAVCSDATVLQGVAPCIEKTEIYSQKVGFRVPAASDHNAPQLRDVIKAGAWDYQFSLQKRLVRVHINWGGAGWIELLSLRFSLERQPSEASVSYG